MSGLPSGYTQLEYIESSGTQYIDTGVRVMPENYQQLKMSVTCEKIGQGSGATTWFVDGSNVANAYFYMGVYNGKYYYGCGTTDHDTGIAAASGKQTFTLDIPSAKFTVSGSADVSISTEAVTTSASLYLFGFNYNPVRCYAEKIYSCQIYTGATLVRDLIPCKNAYGAVGLYDTVEGQFYGNAGTGTFTAGPEVVYEPDAPTNFAASVSGQTVALSWAAAANAAGYRLKRDGVQIADQTGTTYTDTVPDGTTLCTYALTAYNDAGESAASALTVILRLDLITDRTRADVENETEKGFYNASDLNRVGAAVEYIAGRFAALGYACPVTVKKDWLTSDAPTASQMETYRQNIVTLRSRIAVMVSTPEAPASIAGLNYVKANNIEMILLTLNFILNHIPAAVRHCGVTVCGGKGVRA
nr:MAG TPA: Chitinase [Caudoviricetes sp.]